MLDRCPVFAKVSRTTEQNEARPTSGTKHAREHRMNAMTKFTLMVSDTLSLIMTKALIETMTVKPSTDRFRTTGNTSLEQNRL